MNKISIANKAHAELKRRILDNEMSVGQQFMEGEIAELLNISRTPAREAMMKLEVDGLVEIRPRHGMKIKPISINDITEIYAVLTGLEATAAWQAAQRDHNEEDLKALRDSVHQMDVALKKKDLLSWAQADEDFHKLLVLMSGNARLIELVDRYIDQSHRVRMSTLRLRPLPNQSTEDHAKVVAAIEAKDANKARKLHQAHREKAGKMIVKLLQKHGFTQL